MLRNIIKAGSGIVYWIYTAQGSVQWRAVVNKVVQLRVP
jgi:hypothetical protein